MSVTRPEIIRRGMSWVNRGVPYSMFRYLDGWRTDCSGLVSMAWRLDSNRWTGNLAAVGQRIPHLQLQPGDMLLYHNPGNPHSGSHVVLFERWVDRPGGDFWIIEQTPPRARRIRWSATRRSNLAKYVPFQRVGLLVEQPPTDEGEDEMKIILGNLDGRDTVFSGLRGVVPLLAHTSEEAVNALAAAGAVRRTFKSAQAMLESMGAQAGDPDGTQTLLLMERAG